MREVVMSTTHASRRWNEGDLAELARRLPSGPLAAPPGREELQGFAVVGLPFASGDMLCLRRFPASSIGPAYDSVWHRGPDGEWTIYTTVSPRQSCPRFIGAAATRVVETPIAMEWTGPSALVVRIPEAGLRWDMRMAPTPITRLMNYMLALMPAALYRSDLVLSLMSRMSTLLLAAGRLQLRGRVPNRQRYQAHPRRVAMIPEARASIDGRDLGPLGPLARPVALGDFALPQRGVFMFGRVSFEAFASERHLPAPEALLLPAPISTRAVEAATRTT
jgi:hypothetical protein